MIRIYRNTNKRGSNARWKHGILPDAAGSKKNLHLYWVGPLFILVTPRRWKVHKK